MMIESERAAADRPDQSAEKFHFRKPHEWLA
jgi:hypothetical protein